MAVTFGCVLFSGDPESDGRAGCDSHPCPSAEALGFHALWLADHIVIPRAVAFLTALPSLPRRSWRHSTRCRGVG